MNQRLFFQLLFSAGLSTLMFSCEKDFSGKQMKSTTLQPAGKGMQDKKVNTFKGPQVHIGNGMMCSFIIISHTGVPQEIGVEMTGESLQGLPASEGEYSFIVPLHKKATQVTPFDHLEVGWNPYGHPPPGIYSLPHFDFHFYKISLAQQMAIPPYSPQTASLFDNYPPEGYIPANYIAAPEGVPQMGKHWLDLLSGEFNGQTFTKTFVYGTYNGAVTFYEPMVTKAYIETGVSNTTDIRQPQYFSPTNTYYPSKYNIYTDAATGKHYISLSGFEWR
jgi:hypothetical protein